MGKQKPETVESVRDCLRRAAQDSGMTQEEIGLRMGYSKSGARQAVSRLLNHESEYDPRLSTLLAFAHALNCSLKELLQETKNIEKQRQ
jgi:transcriptional regulator with XRE-family HTH domain